MSKSALFTLNRDHVLASTLGHAIEFAKDVPTMVPAPLHAAVIAIGAVLHEGEVAQEAKTTEPDGDKRADDILAAIEVLVDRNERTDFGANGRPQVSALALLLGWKPNAAEVAALWARFQADKE